MPTQFSICILTSERPSNTTSLGIAFALPGCDLASGSSSVPQSPAETLALQNADLDFCHVQPARMLGRVMEHDASQKRAGGPRAEHLCKAGSEMRVEIVENQVNLSGGDRKSTRLNSSHIQKSRMPSSA